MIEYVSGLGNLVSDLEHLGQWSSMTIRALLRRASRWNSADHRRPRRAFARRIQSPKTAVEDMPLGPWTGSV